MLLPPPPRPPPPPQPPRPPPQPPPRTLFNYIVFQAGLWHAALGSLLRLLSPLSSWSCLLESPSPRFFPMLHRVSRDLTLRNRISGRQKTFEDDGRIGSASVPKDFHFTKRWSIRILSRWGSPPPPHTTVEHQDLGPPGLCSPSHKRWNVRILAHWRLMPHSQRNDMGIGILGRRGSEEAEPTDTEHSAGCAFSVSAPELGRLLHRGPLAHLHVLRRPPPPPSTMHILRVPGDAFSAGRLPLADDG